MVIIYTTNGFLPEILHVSPVFSVLHVPVYCKSDLEAITLYRIDQLSVLMSTKSQVCAAPPNLTTVY